MSKKFNLVLDRDDDSFSGTLKRHFVAFALLVAICIAIPVLTFGAFTVGVIRADIAAASHSVTLTSPDQNTVPAYHGAASGAMKIVTFPSGQNCAYISGPLTANIGGKSMQVYNVKCNGETVYIDAAFIR
jgi:hypothetical protein